MPRPASPIIVTNCPFPFITLLREALSMCSSFSRPTSSDSAALSTTSKRVWKPESPLMTKDSTGRDLPLIINDLPEGSASKNGLMRRWFLELIRISSSFASAANREVICFGSPVNLNLRFEPSRGCTTTRPASIPVCICIFSSIRSPRSLLSSRINLCSSSADPTARLRSSSWVIGTPNSRTISSSLN